MKDKGQKDSKDIKQKNSKAIPLQTVIIVMVTAGFLISCFLVYYMHHTSHVYMEMREATQDYVDCQGIASDLLAKSDAMTIYARGFVVTGDLQQAKQYYSDISAQNAIDEALNELHAYSTDERVISQLNNAMQLRERLAITEDYAMRLKVESIGGDINDYPEKLRGVQLLPADILLSPEEQDAKARDMLFDIEYESSKNEISLRINKSMDVLMSKMLERQVESSDHMLRVLYIQHSLTGALMLALVVLAVIIFTMVILPLRRAVNSMNSAEKLGEEGASEIQFLAQTYNRLYDQNLLAHEKLSYEATHDQLTNVYNRTAYVSALENITAEGSEIALILVDVDHFKSINDHYGHDMGDVILEHVADTLLISFRKEDMVCRIGGDEFAVIMNNTDSDLRSIIIDKVKNVMERLTNSPNGMPSVTISAGVAFTDQLMPGADLFKSADLALYEVKNGERNGLGFSSSTGTIELVSFTPDPDSDEKNN